METTEVFAAGVFQAVRLPANYHISNGKIGISRLGNSIILTPIKDTVTLDAFLKIPCVPDFTVERDNTQDNQIRELFE